MAERKSEKLRRHRIQCMVLLYVLLVLSAIIAASLLYTVVAVGPMLPEVRLVDPRLLCLLFSR